MTKKKETIWLSHPDWDSPREIERDLGVKLLKNQKLPHVPRRYRDAYKQVGNPTLNDQVNESSTDTESDNITDKEAETNRTSKKGRRKGKRA